MKPTDQLTSNITLSDTGLFLKNTVAGSSANKQLSALLAVNNSGQDPKPDLTYLDIMPENILQLIARATPLTDRKSLSDALNSNMGLGRYIANELKLSEFIITRVSEIATLKDFLAALRDIPTLLRSDQVRALEALSGSLLNLTDPKPLRLAIIAYIEEATSLGNQNPSLKNLVNVLNDVNDNAQLIENFSCFIFKQLKTEKNCHEIAIKYGVTQEEVLHNLEHRGFELLSHEEVEKSHSHKEIALKYGFFESCVLELLEHKFVEYRAGVDVLKGESADNIAVRYNISTPMGRNRLYQYHSIAKKIMAGGNCFQLSQLYYIDLHNETSRIAMEELSIKHVAGAALLKAKDWRTVASRYGILTSKSRRKLKDNLLHVRAVRQVDRVTI
ncbi:hypothetical protein ACL2XO_04460 [Sodalis sp. RH15]|uniref:hypothetical protein n=1 Tax=Sodalis sp. RH15 TaxID=3394330 RepID=UPI0039B4A9D6